MGYELDEEKIPSWMKKTTVTRATAGSKSVLQCDGCGHEWVNRVDQPQKCPGPDCGAEIIWDDDPDDEQVESVDGNESEKETDDLEDLFSE